MSTSGTDNQILDSLIGLEITEVAFVRDYLEIVIDKLKFFVYRDIFFRSAQNSEFKKAEISYESLISQVGERVIKVTMEDSHFIDMILSSGTSIRLEIDTSNRCESIVLMQASEHGFNCVGVW